jgi:hypothetical protein
MPGTIDWPIEACASNAVGYGPEPFHCHVVFSVQPEQLVHLAL